MNQQKKAAAAAPGLDPGMPTNDELLELRQQVHNDPYC